MDGKDGLDGKEDPAGQDVTALAVRYLLQVLADAAPGSSVEVRVPPYGAVQCIQGPGHSRGTPANVVESDAASWLALATGSLAWADGIETGRVHASGQRADLGACLPLTWASVASESGRMEQ
ncbi:MAG: sterol carrier family protein [Microbacteriaceae bacterium]